MDYRLIGYDRDFCGYGEADLSAVSIGDEIILQNYHLRVDRKTFHLYPINKRCDILCSIVEAY